MTTKHCSETKTLHRHGPIVSCPESATRPFLEKYLSLPKNSPYRAVMEIRFGGKRRTHGLVEKEMGDKSKRIEENESRRVRKADRIRNSVQTSQSTDWILRSTVSCPNCSCPIEKNGGCNHVSLILNSDDNPNTTSDALRSLSTKFLLQLWSENN